MSASRGKPGSARPVAAPNFELERALAAAGCARVAGVDEAGRGPLAGPVVAAAVIFKPDFYEQGLPESLRGLNDSKRLAPKQRERFYEALLRMDGAAVGVAQVEPEQIDAINILNAAVKAMAAAAARLDPPPDHCLIDGRPPPAFPWPHTAVVRGDGKSFSIAAAGVAAKVVRDRLMIEYDRAYPGYGFARHKGYGTREHLEAIRRLGPCPIHRRSFEPIASLFPSTPFPNDLFQGLGR